MPKPSYVTSPLRKLPANESITVLDPEFRRVSVNLYPVDGSANENAVEACIETPRLLIFSIGHAKRERSSVISNLRSLYRDPATKFITGEVDPDPVQESYSYSQMFWDSGNIFSSFEVTDKDGITVGLTSMDAFGSPGVAKYFAAFDRKDREEGYSVEATVAHAFYWAPYIRDKGYRIDGAPLESIVAEVPVGNYFNSVFPLLKFSSQAGPTSSFVAARNNTYEQSVSKAAKTASYTQKAYKLGFLD